MERFKVGIIGAGHIARKMAHTLRDMEGVEPYAVASRNQENAEGFACEWGFTRAYGSYEDLADDPEVQLIYIATPHSHHFEQARMCLEKGKPVLCEKAFTANAEQAETLIRLSKEKQVFLTEAIWTRYMPFSETLRELVDGGTIGRVMMLTANIGYPIAEKERIAKPEQQVQQVLVQRLAPGAGQREHRQQQAEAGVEQCQHPQGVDQMGETVG